MRIPCGMNLRPARRSHWSSAGLGEILYRSITRDYRNDTYYTKGLLRRELTADAAGAPFTETENGYTLRDVDLNVEPVDGTSTTASVFPQLTRTDRRFFEGQVSPGKTTFTAHTYDTLGNIATFTDDGEPGTAADNVAATITYTNCQPAYIIKPNHIEVKGNGTTMRATPISTAPPAT